MNRCLQSPPSGVLPSPHASSATTCPAAGRDLFLTHLDEKLRRRNERLIDRLIAWGVLLDTAGWSVALEWGGGDFWLSGNAARDLGCRDRNSNSWPSLLAGIRRVAGESLHPKSEGVLIWPGLRKQGPSDSTAGLTRRENEVMDWLRQGKTTTEISIILGCAPRTVEKHLANLYRKLGVRNRASVILSTPEIPI